MQYYFFFLMLMRKNKSIFLLVCEIILIAVLVGSIVLAAIVLKLSLYGIFRIVLPATRSRKSLVWDQLPNSGNSLKLWVPNKSHKDICGWINYSSMVIILMMKETEIGNRGSKSITIFTNVVKEPRVYGSWHHSFFLECV